MSMIQEELSEQGIDINHIIVIDLDDTDFRKIKTDDDLETKIEELSDKDGLKYLFIDEIQNVKGFEFHQWFEGKGLFHFYYWF